MDIKLDDIQENVVQDSKFNWKKFFLIILSIVFCVFLIVIYSRYKATSDLKVNEYKVTDSNLPDSFHGVKLVHFSDVYFGNTIDINYLEKLVSNINDLKPDIVVFTGDFIDKSIDNDLKSKVISFLSSINSTIGKYSIKGDIDDSNVYNEIFMSSGFIDISDNHTNIYYNGNEAISIGNTDFNSELFSILLMHKPDLIDEYSNHFNLILAGHSLNGQINLPFFKKLFLKDGCKKYYSGYYDYNGTPFYVSNGLGTTSFKFRFNNTPSINLYRLTKY